jgi:hypothetical protein
VRRRNDRITPLGPGRLALASGCNGAILLKNSLSAMFDFLGGLWARHSKNQLGD